jgi:hypothetical protein
MSGVVRRGRIVAVGLTVVPAVLVGGCAGDRDDRRERGDAAAGAPSRLARTDVPPKGFGGSASEPREKAPAMAHFSEGFEIRKASKWQLNLNEERAAPFFSWPRRGPVRRIGGGNTRDGSYKLRFEVVPKPTVFRSEIVRSPVPIGSDNWYGFSVFIPKKWRYDREATILAQWHAEVDLPVDNYPVASLYLIRDSWQVRLNWNGSGITSRGPGWGKKIYRLGAAAKGRWNDWVVRGKWSYRRDGLLEVWHDGVKAVEHRGPNAYNNESGPYFKMGIYHPAWRRPTARIKPGAQTLVSYADAIRFARNAGYDAVRPR